MNEADKKLIKAVMSHKKKVLLVIGVFCFFGWKSSFSNFDMKKTCDEVPKYMKSLSDHLAGKKKAWEHERDTENLVFAESALRKALKGWCSDTKDLVSSGEYEECLRSFLYDKYQCKWDSARMLSSR